MSLPKLNVLLLEVVSFQLDHESAIKNGGEKTVLKSIQEAIFWLNHHYYHVSCLESSWQCLKYYVGFSYIRCIHGCGSPSFFWSYIYDYSFHP